MYYNHSFLNLKTFFNQKGSNNYVTISEIQMGPVVKMILMMMIFVKDVLQMPQFWILLILPGSEPRLSCFSAVFPVPSFLYTFPHALLLFLRSLSSLWRGLPSPVFEEITFLRLCFSRSQELGQDPGQLMNICWCSDKGRALRCQEFPDSLPGVPSQPSPSTLCVHACLHTQHISQPILVGWEDHLRFGECTEPSPLTKAPRPFWPGFSPLSKSVFSPFAPFHCLMVRLTCRRVGRMHLGAQCCVGAP